MNWETGVDTYILAANVGMSQPPAGLPRVF